MHPLVKRMRQFSVSNETLPYLVDFLQDDPDTYDFGVALFEVLNNSKTNENDFHLLWKALINDSILLEPDKMELSELSAQITWKRSKAAALVKVKDFFNLSIDWLTERFENLPVEENSSIGHQAVRLCLDKGASVSWAETILEKVGDCSSAFELYKSNMVSFIWLKKLIETHKCVYGAYELFMYHNGITRQWAERIIEQAECGDPPYVAFLMATKGKSQISWAKKIIEEAKCGDPSYAAFRLCQYRTKFSNVRSMKKWAKRIIENDTVGDPISAADLMLRMKIVSREWARKVFKKRK